MAGYLISLLIFVGFIMLLHLFKTKNKSNNEKSIAIIWGSGGHTTEMLILLSNFNFDLFKKIYFFKASSDKHSEIKLNQIMQSPSCSEQRLKSLQQREINWITLLRSREVKQSYFTSIFTTFFSILQCIYLMFSINNIDILISNGPGTALPIILIALVLKVLRIRHKAMKIIFIESICRVKSLSLTGKVLYYLVDIFVVQWPNLKQLYPKAIYNDKNII